MRSLLPTLIVLLATSDAAADCISVMIDSRGSILALWQEPSVPGRIAARVFRPGRGWLELDLQGSPLKGAVGLGSTALNTQWEGAVIWTDSFDELAGEVSNSYDDLQVSRLSLRDAGRHLPGDCNQDQDLNLSDALCCLGTLFLGSATELPCGDGSTQDPGNITLMDWQADAKVDLADAVGLLHFLFLGGSAHPLAIPGAETSACIAIGNCASARSCP